jgi:hypothetical protein
MFHIHFEKNLENKSIEKLKENLNDRSKMSQLEQNIQVKFYNMMYALFYFDNLYNLINRCLH